MARPQERGPATRIRNARFAGPDATHTPRIALRVTSSFDGHRGQIVAGRKGARLPKGEPPREEGSLGGGLGGSTASTGRIKGRWGAARRTQGVDFAGPERFQVKTGLLPGEDPPQGTAHDPAQRN